MKNMKKKLVSVICATLVLSSVNFGFLCNEALAWGWWPWQWYPSYGRTPKNPQPAVLINSSIPSARFGIIQDEHLSDSVFNTARDKYKYKEHKSKGLWFSLSNNTLTSSSKGIDRDVDGSTSVIANVGYNMYDMSSSIVLSFAKTNVSFEDSGHYGYSNVMLSYYSSLSLSKRSDTEFNTLLSYISDSDGEDRLSAILSVVKSIPITLASIKSIPFALDTEFRIGYNTGIAKGIVKGMRNIVTLTPVVKLATDKGLVFKDKSTLNANVFVKYDYHILENKSKFKISDALSLGVGAGYNLSSNVSINLASALSNNGLFGIDLGVGFGW